MFGMATMVYLNDDGVECEIVVQEFEKITSQPIEQLRECVVAAAVRK
jgi:predicted enzyme involved in methoxymalonyl-ACP biosynthesis